MAMSWRLSCVARGERQECGARNGQTGAEERVQRDAIGETSGRQLHEQHAARQLEHGGKTLSITASVGLGARASASAAVRRTTGSAAASRRP